MWVWQENQGWGSWREKWNEWQSKSSTLTVQPLPKWWKSRHRSGAAFQKLLGPGWDSAIVCQEDSVIVWSLFFFPCHKAKQPWMLTTAGEWGFRKFLVGEREKWNTRSLCKERDHRCPCEVGMCLHGTHPGLLSHDLRPLACPNSPAPEGNAACTCDSCSPYTFSFCFRLEKTLPSFDPFKTLPQPLSHICFSRRKNIIKSFTFTLYNCKK